MSNLLKLQQNLQTYLLTQDPEISQYIIESTKISSLKRLEIYYSAYRSRLAECLANNYPILKRHIGAEAFQSLAYAYVEKTPSSYHSIRCYGKDFAKHLNPTKPWLAELALFEWHLNLAFDAKEASSLTLADIAVIPACTWPGLKFLVHPSLLQISLSWNVVDLWQTLNHNKQFTQALSKNPKPRSWVIWRSDYTTRFYCLAEDEAWALTALQGGASFAALCAGLCQWKEEDVALRAASILKSWVSLGILSKVF